MPETVIVALLGAVGGIGASSGLWAYISKRSTSNTAYTRLLMGLAYDKIVTLGMAYIQRGWISKDEYEEYLKYLVEPYKDLGGNGVAERIASQVGSLPFRTLQFAEVVIKGKTDNGPSIQQ